jgi:hypothetical protein
MSEAVKVAHAIDRRLLLSALPWAGATLLAGRVLAAEPGPAPTATPDPRFHPYYPSQEPETVREMVGVSHGNVARVRELLAERPALARASWDWGWGDWETALDAASHVGNREIAELLLDHGARMTLFCAAMLGQLAVVRAAIEARPGIQQSLGPHGITLLAHAKAGGPGSVAVVAYLESLGDADPQLPLVPITVAETTKLVGSYELAAEPRGRFEVTLKKDQLQIERPGGSARWLLHLGGNEFFPKGCDAVRIGFAVDASGAAQLTIRDGGHVLTAARRST